MELKCHRYDTTYSIIQKRLPIQKRIFCKVKNGMKMFGFQKLKAIHHNIIVIQVLDRVYNVIPMLQIYIPCLEPE